jgi:hypothetical protein
MLFLALAASPGKGATVENARLIVRDATGRISPEKFEPLAKSVDATFAEVLRFWMTGPRIVEFGKIIVQFEPGRPGGNTSFFYWGSEQGRKVRIVRVFGGEGRPEMLAHKLTSAVFPNPDKLIRNMMGETSEDRFGNPMTFPACGFDKGEWIMALIQTGRYLPLARLGKDHADWGMEIVNNAPHATDRAKQHAAYLEAGSFGVYLVDSRGVEPMKRLNMLAKNGIRPWNEVYGEEVDVLEAKWLAGLRGRFPDTSLRISALIGLLKQNADTACQEARLLGAGGM